MATSNVEIDFHAIAKAYFQQMQGQQARIASSGSQMMAPDFRNVKLTVKDISWKKSSSDSMSASAFANVTKNPDYPVIQGEAVSGHIQAVAPMDEGHELQITRGRIADIGRTLKLPIPDEVRKVLGTSDLEIDPGNPEKNKVLKNLEVTQRMEWETIPTHGATAQVVSGENFRYEGTFSCKVFPKGKCMLQRTGNNIQGGEPDIQKMIGKLKEARSALVKNFEEEITDSTDSKYQLGVRYFWRLEGSYWISKGSKLEVK